MAQIIGSANDAFTIKGSSLQLNTTTAQINNSSSAGIEFQPSGTGSTKTTFLSSQTSNQIITIPDATTTLVGTDTTDTLVNKTLTLPTISTIDNGGTLFLPDGPDNIIGRIENTFLSNKQFYAGSCQFVDASDATKQVVFSLDGKDTGTITALIAAGGNASINLPTSNTTLVGDNTTNTFTNKILSNASCKFADGSDISKTVAFNSSGKTAGTASTFSVSGGSQTITFPTGSITLADLTTTQTLVGKSLGDGSDNTKTVTFNISGKTTGTASTFAVSGGAQTITFPTGSITLADTTTTQTLVGKSLGDGSDNTKTVAFNSSGKTTGTASTFSVSGGAQTITFPTGSITLADTTTTQTFVGKSFGDGSDSTKKVTFDISGKTTGTTSTFAVSGGAQTVTVPSGSITLADTTSTQSLAAKTLTGGTMTGTTNINASLSSGTTNIGFQDPIADNTVNINGVVNINTGSNHTLNVTIGNTAGATSFIVNGNTNLGAGGGIVRVGDSVTPGAVYAFGSTIQLNSNVDASSPTGTIIIGNAASSTSMLGATSINASGASITSIGNINVVDVADNTKKLAISTSGKTTGTTSTLSFSGGGQTITFPAGSGTLADLDSAQTLTTKNLTAGSVMITDGSDATKKVGFSVSGKTTGTTSTFSVSGGAQTITFPTGTITVADLSTTQTLAGKTLTTPTINSPSIATPTITGTTTTFSGLTAYQGLCLDSAQALANPSTVFPYVYAYRTTSQAVVASTYTDINFSTVASSPLSNTAGTNAFTASTGTFTCPTGGTGMYAFSLQAACGDTTNAIFATGIHNPVGATGDTTMFVTLQGPSVDRGVINATIHLFMTTGDTFRFKVHCGSSTLLYSDSNRITWMTFARIW